MASNYTDFDVTYRNETGQLTPAPDVTVKVYDTGAAEDIDELTADSDGHIAAGTLDVDAGTIVRFRVESFNGLAGVLEQTTT